MAESKIDVRRLEALVAVHRTGSVSGAAEALHYGQPTISHHLRRLEAETGSVLLQRVGRGVRLTPDGVRLAQRGEEILGLLGRAEAELVAARDLATGRVRLAAFPSAAATLVPRAIAGLSRTAPGLSLDLVEAEPPEAVGLLRSGAVDVALTFGYEQDGDGVASVRLFDDPLLLVTPAEARGDAIDDFGDARWVTGCERCRRELVALCAAAGFEPEVAFASDDYVAVQALVAAGVGVSVLPRLALVAHRHPGVRTHAIGAHRTVYLATHGQPPRPAAVDAVLAVLTSVAVPGRPEAPSARH